MAGINLFLRFAQNLKTKIAKSMKKINHDIYISIYIICKDEQEKYLTGSRIYMPQLITSNSLKQ